jgi:hypothetical protein
MHNTKVQVILWIAVLLCCGSLASNAPQGKTNLAEVKKGIELFDSVLNQSLAQAFGGPFETLDRARGAYLPGYGVVFSFEVNLTPLQNLGPFSPAPSPKTEQVQREEEIRRRDKSKNTALEVLGNYGQALGQLAPDESITIVIYTVAAHPSKVDRSTIVISADKKLLDARVSHAIDQAHFVQKLSITEY